MRLSAVVFVAAGLMAKPLHAQEQAETNTQSGQASASVVQPLRVEALDDLSFGTFAIQSGQGGEITISETGSGVTYSDALSPVCSGDTLCAPHQARFAVSGQSNRDYGIGLPSQVSVIGQATGVQLLVDPFVVRGANDPSVGVSGRTNADGQYSFSVGGNLQVPGSSRPDRYRGELTVTVFHY